MRAGQLARIDAIVLMGDCPLMNKASPRIQVTVRAMVFVLISFAGSGAALASFHLMQIEQAIGGVDGDTTAQAIQLRMRAVGENLVSSARVIVVDATGTNAILVKDMTSNVASNAA